MKQISLPLILILLSAVSQAQILDLPPRPATAPKGQAFINQIWSLSREERENAIFAQVMQGNLPDFLRQLVRIEVTATSGTKTDTVIYFVTPDYLAIGADEDYFLTPMTPLLAQKIADSLKCSLPTKKMVDDIYLHATVKLRPQPIAPSAAMITVPVFAQHNDSVWSLRAPLIPAHPLGELVGGTKKDVIISNKIYKDLKATVPKPVVIYGWHQLNGVPIQPVYNGHEETYADYSHGIRLVQNQCWLNGQETTIAAVLKDAEHCMLLSDEGIISVPRYSYPIPKAPTPKSFGIQRHDSRSLKVQIGWSDSTNYMLYYGTDGEHFLDSLPISGAETVVTGLQTGQIYYFRLRALKAGLVSDYSEVLAAIPCAEPNPILIINGFDRATSSNTYNYIRQHGNSFRQNDYYFDSATNEAVTQGLISLNEYAVLDYIIGEESTVDETFSADEQNLIKVFLQNGGCLLVSGAEIAWDLDNKGSPTDKEFYHQYLKASYVMDAPNNTPGVYYRAVPVGGGIFDGLGNLYFDNGTRGTYNVKYPDVINAVEGGSNCLQYGGLSNQYAGVYFAGLFPNGTKPGKVVNLGVPLETFYIDSMRAKMVARVMEFFQQPVDIAQASPTVNTYALEQNFPNPFNSSTTIAFSLPIAEWASLTIFDLCGRRVADLVTGYLPAGVHRVAFDASRYASGVYFYHLNTPQFAQTRKMQIIK